MAEGSCLLSSCGGNSTPGSNPGLSEVFELGRAGEFIKDFSIQRINFLLLGCEFSSMEGES